MTGIKQSKAMGLDVGDARVGVALSDPLGLTAQPFATIERAGKRSIQEIVNLVADQAVSRLIVGLPLELDGSVGPQARKVQDFAEQVKAALERRFGRESVQMIYWDERLTTVAAQRVTAGSGLKNKDCRAALDRVSAALILEGYLSSQSTAAF